MGHMFDMCDADGSSSVDFNEFKKCTSGGPDPDSTDGASGASGSSGASGASGATGNQGDNCQQCVEEFDKRGGCADMHNGDMQAVQSKIPEGCGHCGDKAKDYCGIN